MKLFKKLTALIIALVLALAMFALAACGDKNETEQPDDNQQGEEGNGNGNGDNDGDGNGDDSGDDGEVTIATIIAALEKAEISNVSITGTVNGSRTYKKSTDKTNWTDLPDKQLTLGASFDIKVDAKGDMDMHSTHSTERKAPDQDNPNTYFSGYSFIRSGEQFYKNEESKTKMPDAITNWDNQTLNYQSSSDLPDDQMWAKMLNIGLGNLDKISYINRVNSVLIQLADATKSLTLEDGKATIDLFKLAHTVLSEIDKDFQTIKASTTVEQVLELNSIKTYLPIIVNAVTIEEAVNLAKGFAPEGEPWSTLIGVIDGDNKVAPDENSTLWDYLVKLLKSDELKDAANKILTDEGLSDMEGVGTLSKPVAEISCDYIMNLIGHILSNGGSSSGPGGPSESNPGPNVDAGGPQEDSYPAATEAEVGNNEENPEEDIFSDYKKIVSYYAGLVSETKI